VVVVGEGRRRRKSKTLIEIISISISIFLNNSESKKKKKIMQNFLECLSLFPLLERGKSGESPSPSSPFFSSSFTRSVGIFSFLFFLSK